MSVSGGRDPGAARHGLATSLTLTTTGNTDPSCVVGVIDTGVVLHDERPSDGTPHPFLEGRLSGDWRHNEDRLEPVDGMLGVLDGHGTAVAGLILNEAPTVSINMSNALDGATGGDDQAVAKAIRALAGVRNLKIVNLSFFGVDDRESGMAKGIGSALDDLRAAHPDVLVVAAAGNSWSDTPVFPAAFDGVIAVGAVDETVVADPFPPAPPKASFSNHGPWVDVYASGVDVVAPRCWFTERGERSAARAPQTFTGWARMSGTSFAAATVTGLLAQQLIDGAAAGEALRRLGGEPVLGLADERRYVRGRESIWPV